MGKFVTNKETGETFKAGTLGEMYYIRYEDLAKIKETDVIPKNGHTFFRLPMPFEDAQKIGEYDSAVIPSEYHYKPVGAAWVGYILRGFKPVFTERPKPRTAYIETDIGYTLSYKCHHGYKLDQDFAGGFIIVNNNTNPYTLGCVKVYDNGKISPVIFCPGCGAMYEAEWDEVLPHVHDNELKRRLEKYSFTTEEYNNEA